MKTTKLALLKKQWNEVCIQYAIKFANKQGLDFDGWAGEIVGGIGCFGDYFFNLDDIRHDIDTKQPKGLIMRWQDDSVAAHFYKLKTANINYKAYTKGMRFE